MSDRLASAVAALFDAFLPRIAYHLVWEYTVQAVHGVAPPITLDLNSTSPTVPNLVGVTIWPGPDGSVAAPVVGSIARVGFANGDSTKPMVVGLDPNAPTTVFLGGGSIPVARLGDSVSTSSLSTSTNPGFVVTSPSGLCTITVAPGGYIFSGSIISASNKVNAS